MLLLSVISSVVIVLNLGKSFPKKNLHSSAHHLHACNLLIFNAPVRKFRCSDNFKKIKCSIIPLKSFLGIE